jgi:predicted CoA-substrate-specific enzyme activase
MTPVMASRAFLAGIDIGSTTAKAVVVERGSDQVIWSDYQRHEARLSEKVHGFLQRMERDLGVCEGNTRLFFTGSGGGTFAKLVGGRYVQEVNAVSLAVEKLFPEVYSVIELGGQDSKIIIYRDQPGASTRKKIATMNDKCAGGTGAVLDKIRAKLNIPQENLSRQCYNGVRLHRIAGKCGVFSETDVNSLQKQGVPSEELMASLFEAIVLQNLSVLTRGHTLFPRILLLGGPNTFIRGLQEAWREHLPKLWEERGVLVPEGCPVGELISAPSDGHFFGSLGAVEFGRRQDPGEGVYTGLKHLEHFIGNGHGALAPRSVSCGLYRDQKELAEFRQRYRPARFEAPAVSSGDRIAAFLGIDGGSTSTKAVLLSTGGDVLAKAYELSRGNPVKDTIQLTARLRSQIESLGARLEILGVATTGYAKDILQKVLHADLALVETVAHARSAIHFNAGTDVIVDVGGQDIKLIVLKDGHVKDFMLNTQCSAGNGYFLQATAESIGLKVEDYAETAFRARNMPEFSYGCAVFLQSDIVNYQRQGWTSEELLAGLAAVLPKNIWLYVAKVPNLPSLGSTFVLQGGTQRNLAVVKAQVDYLEKRFERFGQVPRIIVHPHCGEAGAIGAALELRRIWEPGKMTPFIGLDAVDRIEYRTTSDETTRCRFCTNQCLRTFVDLRVKSAEVSEPGNPASRSSTGDPIEERFVISTCEKGQVDDLESLRAILDRMKENARKNPNLIETAARTAWRSWSPESALSPGSKWSWRPPGRRHRNGAFEKRKRVRIGFPRILNLYGYAPLFTAYLESLGVPFENLAFSSFTNDSMYREGSRRGSIDPCFPAKVATAHVHDLVYGVHRRKPLNIIFSPMLDTLAGPFAEFGGVNACTTVIAAPQTVRAAFTKEADVFRDHGIDYLCPLLNLADELLFTRQMYEVWQGPLGLTQAENERAVRQGFSALQRWNLELQRAAREVLEMLEREGRLGIVMLGRIYHHDPGLNHGIFDEFQKLGYPVFSQNTLPMDEVTLEKVFGEDLQAGMIDHALDITDVWKHVHIANTSMKLWAAKFTARHPNLVGVELSNFKCGHDAPTYQVIEQIIECAGRPYFSIKDVDENKPAGSFKVRIETIDYFLQEHREELLLRKSVCH